MFKDSSVFILSSNNEIYRLEIDKGTQITICDLFSNSVDALVEGKTCHDYAVNYKPEDDEILRIENFLLQDGIKDAVRNPLGCPIFEKRAGENENVDADTQNYPIIRAIFVGERIQNNEGEQFNIAFQRYRKEQNLSALPLRLFHTKETFKPEKRFGIGITYNIDCYYTGGDLLFTSFFYARQVFDLRRYYRSASDPEVEAFIKNDALDFENADEFCGITNTYVRRKIAMINDSGVLKKYTAAQIKKLAGPSGIEIKTQKKKIIIPANRDAALEVLAFLDEEAYRGPFTNDLLLANSKRVLRKA